MPAKHEEGPKSQQVKQEKVTPTETGKLWESKRNISSSAPPEEAPQHLTINLQILKSARRSTSSSYELFPTSKEELSINHFYPNPNMIKSLLCSNVLQVASGGVHNLSIIEENTNSLYLSLYNSFMGSNLTDFCFIVEKVRINVHRAVLSHRSQAFSMLFQSKKVYFITLPNDKNKNNVLYRN